MIRNVWIKVVTIQYINNYEHNKGLKIWRCLTELTRSESTSVKTMHRMFNDVMSICIKISAEICIQKKWRHKFFPEFLVSSHRDIECFKQKHTVWTDTIKLSLSEKNMLWMLVHGAEVNLHAFYNMPRNVPRPDVKSGVHNFANHV